MNVQLHHVVWAFISGLMMGGGISGLLNNSKQEGA